MGDLSSRQSDRYNIANANIAKSKTQLKGRYKSRKRRSRMNFKKTTNTFEMDGFFIFIFIFLFICHIISIYCDWFEWWSAADSPIYFINKSKKNLINNQISHNQKLKSKKICVVFFFQMKSKNGGISNKNMILFFCFAIQKFKFKFKLLNDFHCTSFLNLVDALSLHFGSLSTYQLLPNHKISLG